MTRFFRQFSTGLGATCAICAVTAIGQLPTPAFAQSADTAPQFQLDLNNATTTDDGSCKLVFVATNSSGQNLTQTSYEVGVFDADGTVSHLLSMDFGALTNGKTRIVLFNLPGQTCENVSRIVINDLIACTMESGETSPACISGLATNTKTDIQFGT